MATTSEHTPGPAEIVHAILDDDTSELRRVAPEGGEVLERVVRRTRRLEEKMVDIVHRIGIKASPAEVYAAVATVEGVAGWWSKETAGSARLGDRMTVRFRSPSGSELSTVELRVLELVPDERVRWRIEAGPEEWIGTEVVFTLARAGDLTVVQFGHRNWREAVAFTAHCSTKWASFLFSLRDLVETGTGRPAPDDVKIDDWN